MTFATAIGELIRRAWVLVVAAVIVGASAYLVASRDHPSYSGSAVVQHTTVKAQFRPRTGLKRVVQPLPASIAISSSFLRPPPGVTLSPNTRSTVLVAASGRASSSVEAVITTYLN